MRKDSMEIRDPKVYDAVIELSFAWLGIRVSGGHITGLELSQAPLPGCSRPDPLASEACRRLKAYSEGGEWPEDLPLAPVGTPFQQAVWRLMRAIPAGSTRTYGELARDLASSPRAVGGACRANPIALLIPCHRVVASNGEGGFAGHASGSWPAIKHCLLAIEAGCP